MFGLKSLLGMAIMTTLLLFLDTKGYINLCSMKVKAQSYMNVQLNKLEKKTDII